MKKLFIFVSLSVIISIGCTPQKIGVTESCCDIPQGSELIYPTHKDSLNIERDTILFDAWLVVSEKIGSSYRGFILTDTAKIDSSFDKERNGWIITVGAEYGFEPRQRFATKNASSILKIIQNY